MREYANKSINFILDEIEKYLDNKTHKSALEVLKIISDNKEGSLKEMSKEKWFIHSVLNLENLIYSDEKIWNTSGFEKLYNNIVPMIHFQIKQASEK